MNAKLQQEFPKIGYYPDVGDCELIAAQLLGFQDPEQAYGHELFLTYSNKVCAHTLCLYPQTCLGYQALWHQIQVMLMDLKASWQSELGHAHLVGA